VRSRLPGSCRASLPFVVLVSSPLVLGLTICDVESNPGHSRETSSVHKHSQAL